MNIVFVVLLGFMVLGFIVQARLKSKFKKYDKQQLSNGLSGKEIAEKMLRDNNIHDVRVISTPGRLTDHYNPKDKTVNLSEAVYNERSVAAAAVAAHECGHAVQHATAYSWLEFRSAMVPFVSFSNRAMGIIFMLMLFGGLIVNIFPFETVLWAMIIMQGSVTLFTLVTLPVEYDASNRALVWLESTNTTQPNEHGMAKDALNAAANTYLVAALASITQLAYYVMLLMGRD
jgi:Zn-dependent membrane protease YugP